MKKLYLLFILAVFNLAAISQSLDDLEFGTDTTFEMVTWNIEWFPKNGSTTVNYVSDIIGAIDADVYALQEIDDTVMFRQMVDAIDGYEWFIHDGYFAGLAYVYKTNIDLNDIYRIYDTEPYWRPFPRSPLVMELTFSGNDYIVIDNHYKCCGDGIIDFGDEWDEETRRYDASMLLKTYIDDHWPDKNVMVTGDLNDILTDAYANNVFRMFLDDADNFTFTDMNIANGSSAGWSYPSWPSHLDHILITNDLFDEMASANATTRVLKIDEYIGGWSTYDYNVSDHRPVGIRFTPDNNTDVETLQTATDDFELFPNPAKELVYLSSGQAITSVTLMTLTGRQVLQQKVSGQLNNFPLKISQLPEGIFILKVTTSNGIVITKKLTHN
jgi:hypothetical protein